MNRGAEFMISPMINKTSITRIVVRLNTCSDRHSNCYGCPDVKACVDAYDLRCNLGECICPACKASVPDRKYCSECSANIKEARNIEAKSST